MLADEGTFSGLVRRMFGEAGRIMREMKELLASGREVVEVMRVSEIGHNWKEELMEESEERGR